MKILHYSDQESPEFLKLYEECDVLVATGDLRIFDFMGSEDKQERKPSFGVYGNHDSGLYMERLGITNLHNKTVEAGGFTWGGFQGCPRYKESDLMYTEEEAKHFADTFPYVDILLLHAGGKGLLDDPTDPVHTGSEHVRRYILDKKPKYVFLGHQYSNAEMEIGGVKLYRTYGARIVEV